MPSHNPIRVRPFRRPLWASTYLFGLALAGCGGGSDPVATNAPPFDPAEEFPGGATTSSLSSSLAFSRPLANLNLAEADDFFIGNSLFNITWVTAPASVVNRDGLGPLFNARSCSACHTLDGRGRPPIEPDEPLLGLVLKLVQDTVTPAGVSAGDAVYGDQLHPFGVFGVDGESSPSVTYEIIDGVYTDGTPYELRSPIYQSGAPNYGDFEGSIFLAPRVAPAVFGLGLLDTIPEQDVLAWADPNDLNADGIRGRANWVPLIGGGLTLGRYGWKLGQPTLLQQSAAAFRDDIGITSELFPEQNSSAAQGIDEELFSGGDPEIPLDSLDQVDFYMHTLAPPKRRDVSAPNVRRGREQFFSAGCADCHRPTFETGTAGSIVELQQQRIFPYTDLLLHDMGPGLADGRVEHQAGGSDWRTPPLWGIGLLEVVNGHQFLLHDGRARGVAEAILWHAGEGLAARDLFLQLSASERQDLVDFVEDL